ncbi:response regulator [Streptomyces sp. NPDC004284]|uniref:response regulator n=1 Tax=Streptomyces sp. NPDC004284 TaxID=3364695 RepID=UPI0036C085D3
MTTRVLIADDEALVRGGFRVLVDSAPGLEVVGEAAHGREAVELVRALRPDVALMDIRMPLMDGIEATRSLLSGPDPVDVRILILTTFDLDEYAFGALRAGASGFLLKDTPPAELLSAIDVIASGESLLAPKVTRRLIEEFVRRPGVPYPSVDLGGITEREGDVLRLIARGRSNAEISAELLVTVGTVKTHVSRLLMKLGARDRAQLVIAAYEGGLAGPFERGGR